MNLKPYIPSAPSVIREAIIVLGGVLIAAYVLSKFPKLQKFVQASSINVRDANGNNIY